MVVFTADVSSVIVIFTTWTLGCTVPYNDSSDQQGQCVLQQQELLHAVLIESIYLADRVLLSLYPEQLKGCVVCEMFCAAVLYAIHEI